MANEKLGKIGQACTVLDLIVVNGPDGYEDHYWETGVYDGWDGEKCVVTLRNGSQKKYPPDRVKFLDS